MKPVALSFFSLVFVELLSFPHNFFFVPVIPQLMTTTRWRKDITDKHFKKTLAGEGKLCSTHGTKHYHRSTTVQPQY
jgi:hypothetical protein